MGEKKKDMNFIMTFEVSKFPIYIQQLAGWGNISILCPPDECKLNILSS